MNLVKYHTYGFVLFLGWAITAAAADPPIPEPLRPWETWATWNDVHRFCPTPYSDPKTHRCFWPSRLALKAETNGARFDLGVAVFGVTWVPLPGGTDTWPIDVRSNGSAIPVLEHGGAPAVQLQQGQYQ